MNFLLAYPSEVVLLSKTELVVTGDRAVRSFNEEEVVVGSIREVCIVGKERVRVQCEECGMKFRFSIITTIPRPQKKLCTAIIGLSRPQTIKKCIHIAATLGVCDVLFVATGRGEKSYLTSKILHPDELHREQELAMAQSGDPLPLMIKVISRFGDLNKEDLIEPSQKFLFHPINGEQSSELHMANVHTYIAIGPEAGWSEEEVHYFISKGFASATLGERILRVETALNAVVGKLFY